MLLAVNFHYVSRERRRGRAIYPIATEDFASQLDELARSFEFVSRSDVLAAVEDVRALPSRGCLITFDDGLRQQVELALPLLRERGIPAVFFVCGEPLERPRVLFVHKVHHLRERLGDEQLRPLLDAELARDGVEAGEVATEVATAMYRYDTPEAARLKYLLNVVLGPARPEPVERVFADGFSEAALSEELYVNAEQVRELEGSDALGAHGYTHLPLAALDRAGVRDELGRCSTALERITGVRPRALSYPYGAAAAVTHAVGEEAAAAGFAFGLTMERALNRTLDDPLLLARVDSNDAPGGLDPLVTVNGEGVVVRGGMTAGRTRYLMEAA